MTVKRLLAFLGAVALIVGAVFLRDALDNRSSDATDTTNKPAGRTVTVVCSTEFRAFCDQLDTKKFIVTVEPAGATLDRLSASGAVAPDAWITLDPFPGMTDVLRDVDTLAPLSPDVVAVAADVPELAVTATRSDTLALGCSGRSVWNCIGGAAGLQWSTLSADATSGPVLPGITDPATEAFGLVSFANAVGGYFSNPALDTSSWTDAGFRAWMRTVSAGVRVTVPGTTPLDTMLVRKTEVNIAATTKTQTDASTRSNEFTVVPLDPAIPVVAVVATFADGGNDVVGPITSLLRAGGWSAASDPKPQLPAGTFVALRRLWEESN